MQRTLEFVKYLREFGWEPVVLTARDADYPARDETLKRRSRSGSRSTGRPCSSPTVFIAVSPASRRMRPPISPP